MRPGGGGGGGSRGKRGAKAHSALDIFSRALINNKERILIYLSAYVRTYLYGRGIIGKILRVFLFSRFFAGENT